MIRKASRVRVLGTLLAGLLAVAVVPLAPALMMRAAETQVREFSGPPRQRVSFSGHLRAGEQLDHALPWRLRFRLDPQGGTLDGAWCIQVLGGDSLHDFAAIATPPYHGPNPLQLDAWHFRNDDNTGANDGSVNAPGREREFAFVLDEAEYQRQSQALDIVLWPGDRTQAAQDSALAILDTGARGRGTLTLTELDLAGLGKGRTPSIRSLAFRVQMEWPVADTLR